MLTSVIDAFAFVFEDEIENEILDYLRADVSVEVAYWVCAKNSSLRTLLLTYNMHKASFY